MSHYYDYPSINPCASPSPGAYSTRDEDALEPGFERSRPKCSPCQVVRTFQILLIIPLFVYLLVIGASRLREAALATDSLHPSARVELGVHALDLPALVGAVQVAGDKAVDALDLDGWVAKVGCAGPSECNTGAGDIVDVQELEADLGLGALAGLEGGLAGEGS